jgi:hypothetical protein
VLMNVSVNCAHTILHSCVCHTHIFVILITVYISRVLGTDLWVMIKCYRQRSS